MPNNKTESSPPDAARAPTEAQGTFACSVCGYDKPHWHDVALVNKRRVEESVLRPRFQELFSAMCYRYPEMRVSGWGGNCFKKTANGELVKEVLEQPLPYFDPKVEVLWKFFLATHYAVVGDAAQVVPPDQTHWEGCWCVHHACAIRKVEDLLVYYNDTCGGEAKDAALSALIELVACKDLKEWAMKFNPRFHWTDAETAQYNAMCSEYDRRQPLAWDAARAAIDAALTKEKS